MSKTEMVTIEWKNIEHSRHTGGLVITLPLGYGTIDLLRNCSAGCPKKALEKLIGCESCPAFMQNSKGEKGIARPLYGHRFDEKDDKPSTIYVCCEGTDVDERFTKQAVCKIRFATPQEIEAKLG